jgi:hypothetical protein
MLANLFDIIVNVVISFADNLFKKLPYRKIDTHLMDDESTTNIHEDEPKLKGRKSVVIFLNA